jgi:hypothetical protein
VISNVVNVVQSQVVAKQEHAFAVIVSEAKNTFKLNVIKMFNNFINVGHAKLVKLEEKV